MLHERSDEELMAQVADGHRLAYEVLVRRHVGRAHAIAARFLGTQVAADDVAQEAFIKLWVHAATWQEGRAKFTTWFYRILANQCTDLKRTRKPMAEIELELLPDDRESAEQQLMLSQEQARVKAALDTLPERQKLALVLCYYEGFSNQEAADIMKVNIKALEALLVRGKRTLRELMKDITHDNTRSQRHG